MHIERGIDLLCLSFHISKVLEIIDLTFYKHHSHMVVVASNWAKDNFRAVHEEGNAIDVAAPLINRMDILFKLQLVLGQNYDVRNFKDHFHIAWSPMPSARKKVTN